MANVERILGLGFIMTDTNTYIYAAGGTPWHADLGWHPSMFRNRREPPLGHGYRGVKVGIDPDGDFLEHQRWEQTAACLPMCSIQTRSGDSWYP